MKSDLHRYDTRGTNIPGFGAGTALRTFSRILRIEGLIPFTGCAIVLGLVVALWEVGVAGIDWGLFVMAGVAALLIHIDAHIWNDITDLEVDRQEKSTETGRDRPLVYGWATVGEYKNLSLLITALVIVLTAFLAMQRMYIPLLFIMGFFFDYAYNHPRIALSYHPFTEWYIFPWLVVGVTVTVVYAATGIFSLLAFILSLLHGLTVTCFVVSMMRRDVNSDRVGRKNTTSVLHPELPHSTIYGIVTLIVSVLMLYPLYSVLGRMELAYALILTTAIIAGINTVYGARIDQLCTRALYTDFPDFELNANKLMVKQVGASMIHAAAIIMMVLTFGMIL
jgi:1,4-dihydroxy-2-naphthoate octaprenyltransferase